MSSVKERGDTTYFDRLWPNFVVKSRNVIITLTNLAMNLDKERIFINQHNIPYFEFLFLLPLLALFLIRHFKNADFLRGKDRGYFSASGIL